MSLEEKGYGVMAEVSALDIAKDGDGNLFSGSFLAKALGLCPDTEMTYSAPGLGPKNCPDLAAQNPSLTGCFGSRSLSS